MSKDSRPDGDAEQAGEDLQRLAREYADLWEQQIKAFTTDETLARTMAQTMELMNAGAANVAAMMQKAAQTPEAGADDKGHDQDDGADGCGTTSAGASSGRAEPDVRELARRIAELEKRLSRLEGLTEPRKSVV